MKVYYSEEDGKTLEDNYSGWLRIFQQVAENPNNSVEVVDAPETWGALLWYLGAKVREQPRATRRHQIEATCAAEPVLVDALWKADMRWSGPRRHTWERRFPIATYSGFWRPELLHFMSSVLRTHRPSSSTCVLVPCAADKPYPAPLHRAVREAIGPNPEIMVVSSAVGPVPESCWSGMPLYDAGLPLFERVAPALRSFFLRRDYELVVNYTDMLQGDVAAVFQSLGVLCVEPVSFTFRCDYQPLMCKALLQKLRAACTVY